MRNMENTLGLVKPKGNSFLQFRVAVPLLTENSALASVSGTTVWGYSWLPCEGEILWSQNPHDVRFERFTVTIPNALFHFAIPLLVSRGA